MSRTGVPTIFFGSAVRSAYSSTWASSEWYSVPQYAQVFVKKEIENYPDSFLAKHSQPSGTLFFFHQSLGALRGIINHSLFGCPR